MIIIVEDTYMLESILKDKDNNIIITLLECIIKERIKDFKYIGIQKFNSIIEYDFSLAKIEVTLNNNEQKIIYIKMIKGGQIKESIFCYWSLIYEHYLNNNEYNNNVIPKKVTITEKDFEQNRKSIILNVNNNINYSTEIALIELEQYIIEKSKEKSDLKKLLNYINNHDKDILFLGMIGY